MAKTVSCPKCNIEFLVNPNEPAPKNGSYYCSTGCWYNRNDDNYVPVKPVLMICDGCGAEFLPRKRSAANTKYCTRACYRKGNVGSNHYHWGGGKYLTSRGYIKVRTAPGRTRMEHVLIAEKALGRRLKKGECVHHVNANKSDNRPANLLICDTKYHSMLHHKMSQLYAQAHFNKPVYIMETEF